MNPLTTAFDGLAPLHRPIMVVALQGWFDVAEVATEAADALINELAAPVVASIDPDPFFDFTQERPTVHFADPDDDDSERLIVWPENNFRIVRSPGTAHDLVVLVGIEPHLRFATFANCIITVARELGCELVVTIGASAERVPHTRTPKVVGSTTNEQLATALGLSRPQYQGVTGLVGVLQTMLDEARIPAISLRVGVPYYLSHAKHPLSSAALLHHLSHVLGVPVRRSWFDRDIGHWRAIHDEAVAEDAEAREWIVRLEREHDRRLEADMPSADDLAAEFERFLREQRDE